MNCTWAFPNIALRHFAATIAMLWAAIIAGASGGCLLGVHLVWSWCTSKKMSGSSALRHAFPPGNSLTAFSDVLGSCQVKLGLLDSLGGISGISRWNC